MWFMGYMVVFLSPSMKVPPKRKGNGAFKAAVGRNFVPLNESPSEKEGKLTIAASFVEMGRPSMKVPPKRKGNYL